MCSQITHVNTHVERPFVNLSCNNRNSSTQLVFQNHLETKSHGCLKLSEADPVNPTNPGGEEAGVQVAPFTQTARLFSLPYSAKQLLFLFDLTLKHVVAPVPSWEANRGAKFSRGDPGDTVPHTHTTPQYRVL